MQLRQLSTLRLVFFSIGPNRDAVGGGGRRVLESVALALYSTFPGIGSLRRKTRRGVLIEKK